MRAGRPTTLLVGKTDYKQLRKINPEAARLAVLEYLKTNGHHVSQAAFIARKEQGRFVLRLEIRRGGVVPPSLH